MDISAVETALATGESALASGKHEFALSSCKQGIDELGNSYYRSGILDDTGQNLALAKVEEENGEYHRAAYITCRALFTRISLYKGKSQIQP